MRKEDQIYQQICDTAGIVDSKLNGVAVYFSVKEMYERDGSSVYRRRPSGRYQINVSSFGSRRDTIFRTKIKDGSFNMLDVVDAIKAQARFRLAETEREAAKEANKDVAETIRNRFKLTKTYVSAYSGSSGSYCAPAPVKGLLNVQINFGAVDPAIAEKIMAFAQSLEA